MPPTCEATEYREGHLVHSANHRMPRKQNCSWALERRRPRFCPLWLSGVIATPVIQSSEAEAIEQRVQDQPRLHRDCGKMKQNPTIVMCIPELHLLRSMGLSSILLLETKHWKGLSEK